MNATVALIGARGYTGAEFLKLLARHPALTLAFASSGSHAGQQIQAQVPDWPDARDRFCQLAPEDLAAHEADAWLLAVPNGTAAKWAGAIRAKYDRAIIIDLSADHRFEPGWAYGLPEHHRAAIGKSRNIANPGCYATGAQLALLPLRERLADVPVVFGVSGYSGAGRTPSKRNDPDRLRDNLIPYCLNGHLHEREISHQLQHDVRLMPHVAEYFRGISLSLSARLDRPASEMELLDVYRDWYAEEPRVKVMDAIPEVSGVRGTPDAHIGGFSVDQRDPRRISWVAVLDNLGKGAASQAMQNLNLALQMQENLGIE